MQIEGALPPVLPTALPLASPSTLQTPQLAMPERQVALIEPARQGGVVGPAATVNISPQAQAAYEQSKTQPDPSTAPAQEIDAALAPYECETCNNRKYVDQSDDSSVSFQTPTHISPGQSAAVVLSHEREHVANEQSRADQEGRKVVSQTISLSTAICPECGRAYVSGGTTRTVTKGDNSSNPDAEALAILLEPNT